MTIEDIKQMRAQLPQNWEWRKCYELAYRDFFSDRQTIKRHWALKDPEDLKGVASLGTVSINNWDSKDQFTKEIPVQWIEQSLSIVDFLLAEIDRLKKPNS